MRRPTINAIVVISAIAVLAGFLIFTKNESKPKNIKAVDYVTSKIETLPQANEIIEEEKYIHNLSKEMSAEESILLDDDEIEKYYELLKAKDGRTIFSETIEKEPVITYASENTSGKAVALDWWNAARYLFKVGTVAKVTDVETGISFNIVRTGGINHADNEPLYLKDTIIMKDIVGQWDWHIRPVIVEFNGNRLAASMYWNPHGYQTRKDNGFEGHFCIHFVNSTHHYSGKINAEHQNVIKLAEDR